MSATDSFPIIGKITAPIRSTPKIDVRHLAEGDYIPRGRCGVLRISGGRTGTYRVEPDAVHIEHALFGPRMSQDLPIVRVPLGSPREQLACRCGAASVRFYARPGVGFVCAGCAAKFCNSAREAEVYRVMDAQDALQRRLGMHIDRGGWVSSRPVKLSAAERAKLKAELDLLDEELKRLERGPILQAGSGLLGLASHVGSESVEVEP
jgi:hypothetical protein